MAGPGRSQGLMAHIMVSKFGDHLFAIVLLKTATSRQVAGNNGIKITTKSIICSDERMATNLEKRKNPGQALDIFFRPRSEHPPAGGNDIQPVTIRRLRPKGAGPTWKVADIIPQ
jgi:hypothetical protein